VDSDEEEPVKEEGRLSRRKFLGLVSASGLPALAPPPRALEHGGEDSQRAGVYTQPEPTSQQPVFAAHQTPTLGALAEQIIPADTDPGAREAGVLHYIDRILRGDQASKRPLYAAGLEGVDQTSRLIFDKDFIHLSFQEQTDIVKAIECGEGPGEIWKSVSSEQFFRMLWNHVLEGFYGPPEEGGNKDHVGWKMIGFPEHSGAA
jgi:gluconate 2-dehydrogenase gamma chain